MVTVREICNFVDDDDEESVRFQYLVQLELATRLSCISLSWKVALLRRLAPMLRVALLGAFLSTVVR